ncbi:MAG: carboxypeptidase regulatory-like domain-containing protein [Candidatus Acidiferrales bacterium]
MRKFMPKGSLALAVLFCGLLTLCGIVRTDAKPRSTAAAQAAANSVSVDADDIGGVVTSSNGPEAGVWVIAETTFGTTFRKIVVTNDQGQFLLPQLPNATYKVWVRGYGLVDSPPVDATPGKILNLTAVIAPNPRAAAQYYPADYWASLITIPTKTQFPMTIPPPPPLPVDNRQAKMTHGGAPAGPVTPPGRPLVLETQADWLMEFKGCWTCHQVGLKSTREIPASLGTFKTSEDAWRRFLSSSQVGRGMLQGVNRLNTLSTYANWGDRIAAGELPPVPPRPQGIERNVVLTVWDWSVRASFLHALISTDKRDPSVNAYGPVYGTEWSGGALAVVDPVENTKALIPIPLPDESERPKQILFSPQTQLAPSVYFGDELVWQDPVNPGPITMDEKGRVWFNVENQLHNADFCKAGSKNIFAKNSPREDFGKGVDVYDPKTGKFGFVRLCFKATRTAFSYDSDDTIYFTVQSDPGGIGWVNTRLWDKTHDDEKSQGWCPAVVDYNGDGKIGKYTQDPDPVDPTLDRQVQYAGAYGIAVNPVDGSVWYSTHNTEPGRFFRMVRGSNPPSTCMTEVYEAPYDPKGDGPGGSHLRGIDIDTNGIVWTPLTGEGHLASFDRSKCKVLPPRGPASLTGKQCYEGWTFYPIPGPTFKSDPTVKADYNYYMFIDRYNVLGLGKNAVVVDGANSDSLIVFQQDTKTWVRMTVPYPMGFFSRFLDARLDDPKAGWKGHGAYAANQMRGSQLTEGGGKMPSQLAHFQIRPDPLAK